jgi:prepilin-type N-terminal cleavage/methylation domain-containing protein
MGAARKESGFSFIELLVSLVLTSTLMGAVYGVFRMQTLSIKAQEQRLEAQDYARSVLDIMVREMRNAGYSTGAATCAGIVVANSQTVQFRLDANADGDCADANEDITYAYDAGTQNVTRTEVGGAAENLTDGNATNLQFIYYPQNCTNNFSSPVGGGSTACPASAGGNAGTLTAIQRISATLTVRSVNTSNNMGGGTLNATMTSNVDLRNRGLP